MNQGGDTGMFLTINSDTTTFDFVPSAIILLAGSEFDLKLTGHNNARRMEYYKLMTNVIISSESYIQYLPINGDTATPDNIFCHSTSYPHSDLTMPSTQKTHYIQVSSGYSGYFVFQYKLSLSNNTFSIWTNLKHYQYYTGTNVLSIDRVNLMAIVLK